jgi:hypothetical protein
MTHQAVALVLGDHTDAPNARIQAVRQRKIDDAKLAAEVHRGFGASIGEVLQPAAAAAGQHEGDRTFGQIEAEGQFGGRHGCLRAVVWSSATGAYCDGARSVSAVQTLAAWPSPARGGAKIASPGYSEPHLHR